MEIRRQRLNSVYIGSRLRLTASIASVIAGTVVSATLCAKGSYRDAAVITALSLGTAIFFTAPLTPERVLLAWFATTPLASFFLRYPLDRSILTYDRVVFFILTLLVLSESRSVFIARSLPDSTTTESAQFSLTKFEIAWLLLSVVALASALMHSNNLPYAVRIAVDAFWLPLFAFYFARRYFSLRNGGTVLMLGGAALALFMFITGFFELTTGDDLFRYKGAELVREGERRVNGPFASDSSFAIICMLLFLFLQAAPRLIRMRFDRSGKLTYYTATFCAALAALLSTFRVVAFAMLICWIIQVWLEHRASRRSFWKSASSRRQLPLALALVVVVILIGGWLALRAAPALANRLTDPRSGFGRLATWQAAAEITFENPVIGVGLTNYAEAFDQSHYYSDEAPEEVLETKAVDSPHSNLLWISSELGLSGLVLYIAANVFLFLIGWRAFMGSHGRQQSVASSCYLALVLAYWISGLTLASGYYSDLNLYFLFLLGALSSQFPGRINHAQVPEYI
jgi:O-antigen ligase